MLPEPKPLLAARLADESLGIFFKSWRRLLPASLPYLFVYCAFLSLVSREPQEMFWKMGWAREIGMSRSRWDITWLVIWASLFIPIAQLSLARMTRVALGVPQHRSEPFKLRAGRLAGLLGLTLSLPLMMATYFRYALLVPTIFALDGTSFREALKRSSHLLRARMGIVTVIVAAWIGLGGLLCLLLQFALEETLPWVAGMLNSPLNKLDVHWSVLTLRAVVLALVLPGIQIALGHFYRHLSLYTEGRAFFDSLEEAYPS